MELNRRVENIDANYEFISGNIGQPWYRQKRNIFSMIITTCVVFVIIVIVIAARSARLPHPKVLPPLEWDGVCPSGADECSSSFRGRPILLLVSLDGFRADYLKRGFTPTIEKLSQCGVSAKFMYPVFPSKTFPNHFSQVTGLYPSSHGIIDNNMFDSGRLFKLASKESLKPFWWQKEPIWVTAEKQGIKTATFFWPGSDVSINGTLPTFYKMYNQNILFEDRVDQVHKWLELPEDTRPQFLTLYLNEPDTAAHHHGTGSKEVNDALKRVDTMIERLFSGLQQQNLTGCVNVIIMSDHGMADIDCSRAIHLEKLTDMANLKYFIGGVSRLQLKENASLTERDLLYDLECRNSHMRVFKKEQLPVRMHYSSHPRIEPILLEIDSGWVVATKDVQAGDSKCTGGMHGYDNSFPDMRATFLAVGPSLKKNITVEPFINTELYEMMCELIGVTPNPNNGTKGSLHHLLNEPLLLAPQVEPDSPVVNVVERDQDEYKARVDEANCTCTQANKQIDVDISEKRNFHLPFGIPYSSDDNETLRLLYNSDYVLGFDPEYLMPLWTSFTLTQEMNGTVPSEEVCWTGDARLTINETVQCTDYNATILLNEYILQRPLYSSDFSAPEMKDEAAYVTNAVPKSLNHTNIIEGNLIQLLKKWGKENFLLNVVMGPAFDMFATGIKPSEEDFKKKHEVNGRLLIPTHLFVVATWCENAVDEIRNCNSSDLQVHSFLLPNHPFPHNCQRPMTLIEKNSARVVDIEKLTGLSFFTRLPIYDAIRLRTMMPHRDIS